MPVSKEVQYLIDKHGLQGGGFAETNTAYNVTKKPNVKQDFFSNVGRSLGSIPGAVAGGVVSMLSNNSIAKAPQIGQSIKRTGFSLGPIRIKGTVDKTLEKRDAMMKQAGKDFHAGKMSAKDYSKKLNQIIASTDVSGDMKKSTGALKDASRYGEQFVNNAALIGIVGGGIAGALGKTGVSTAGKAAVEQAYSGGAKAFGRGVLGEVGGLGVPFSEQAAKGGIIKGITGALGGGLDAQAMASTARDAQKGKIDPLNTALTATTLLPGGVIKAGTEGLKATGRGINRAIYDTHGLYDVVKLKGGKSVNEAFNAAKAISKNSKKEEGLLKVFQDLAVQEHGKGPNAVAKAIEANQPGGKKFADMTYKEFLKAADSIVSDRRKLQAIAKKAGLTIPEGTAVVAARLTPESKALISKRLSEADDPLKELGLLKKEGIVKGPNLPGQIEDMISEGHRGDLLAKQVNTLNSAKPILDKAGNVITTGKGRFLAAAKGAGTVKKASQAGEIVQGKKAILGGIGRTFEKAGMSTRAADPAEQKAVFNQVKDNFTKAINANNDIKLTGKEIMNRLNKYADSKKGIFDLRQLRKGEIASVLEVDKATAGTIIKEYNNAFKSLSTADRGLAGKITDFNMRNNPLAPGYSRIQSVARYEMNPSFRTQENIETRLGVASLTGKGAMPFTDKYNDVIGTLRKNGVFKDYFAGPAGEGAAGLGAISAKLSKDQENTLAAALTSMAGGKGKVMDFVTDPKNASMMQDLKAVVQYPDKGFTSSNFMKAMNLAVFPLRYNAKVTSLAAKALGKENGVRQVAILKGISDFNRWQKTPAGTKWNSDNSEALGILKYFTPIGSVESILNILGGNAKTIRDYGTIGGLPFGVISAVLQGQGAVNLDSPYLDPKTGEVVPTKVPRDLKARANQALVDILGTMFTYPGRQVGMDSKRKVSQGIIDNTTFGKLKNGKTESVTRTDLTPEQQRIQAVLRKGTGGPGKYNLPKSGEVKPVSLKKPSYNMSGIDTSKSPRFAKASTAKPKKGKTRAIPVGRFQP